MFPLANSAQSRSRNSVDIKSLLDKVIAAQNLLIDIHHDRISSDEVIQKNTDKIFGSSVIQLPSTPPLLALQMQKILQFESKRMHLEVGERECPKGTGKIYFLHDSEKSRVFTTRQLAENFNRSTKTVRRWAENGLLNIKGTLREHSNNLYIEAVVDHFVRGNKDIIPFASDYSRLSESEASELLKTACITLDQAPNTAQALRNLAKTSGCSIQTIRVMYRKNK
jgi:hypothetical protein